MPDTVDFDTINDRPDAVDFDTIMIEQYRKYRYQFQCFKYWFIVDKLLNFTSYDIAVRNYRF